MRKLSAALCVVAVVAIFSVSAIGQQASLDTAVEPVHLTTGVTLADAARNNDFPSFDAMFRDARDAGAKYGELHDFWQWSLTDPVGAFYGNDMHARLAREYPDYAAFIDEFRIVDAHGNSFYPSSETRAFLLRQAMSGTVARPLVAATKKTEHKVAAKRPVHPASPQIPATVSIPPAVVEIPAVATAVAHTPTAIKPVAAPGRTAALQRDVPDSRFDRGLLLIIAGLIGVGMLTFLLRMPAEEPEREAEQVSDPMEPLRIFKLDREPAKKDSDKHSSVA